MNTETNQLANEHSPYLQQHAKNPVAWYPWGQPALDKAKQLNKPILLSIGYAACHWCHVMAHESFEDQQTAEIMNKYFINIKVDCEERRDLDKVYQIALQLLTGKAGGWPLTLFLTPDNHIPFFGGTYFPKRSGFGVPSFKQVLQQIHLYFTQHTGEIQHLAIEINQQLQQLTNLNKKTNIVLNTDLLGLAVQQRKQEFDSVNGGFGGAPKFPMPTAITCLMHDPSSIAMAIFSLEKMAQGGIHDQIGGGFYRYAVDAAWMIPHFEKMLYDNAALLSLYSQLYLVTQNVLFKNTAFAIGTWVLNEMQSPEGGFYSTLNADSEGVEGKYYVLDRQQVKKLLTNEEYKVVELYFNLGEPANFENRWHLHRTDHIDHIASALQLSNDQVMQHVDAARQTLLNDRKKRVRPDRDEKILTAWNGLMIKALIIAGQSLGHSVFIEASLCALDFMMKNCWHKKRLHAVYKDGQSYLMAYLDDYAFLLDAVITVLQYRWSNELLRFAIEIVESLQEHFYDQQNGGFFFTAHDHERLIQRPKLLTDESVPSGNGVVATCCLRLGYMLGEEKYRAMAESTLQAAWHAMNQYPSAYHTLLFALEEACDPPTIIVLRGSSQDLLLWQHTFYRYYCPHHLCFAIANDVEELPDALNKPPVDKGVIAYLCRGKTCYNTLQSIDEFANYLISVGVGKE